MPILDADFKRDVAQKASDVYELSKQGVVNSYNATKGFASSVQWKEVLVACGISTAITAVIMKVYDDKKVDPIVKAVTDGSAERKEIHDVLMELKDEYSNLRKQLVDKELIAKKDEITSAMQSDYALRRNRAMYKNSLLSNSGLVTKPMSDIMPNASERFSKKSNQSESTISPSASSDLSVVYKHE